MHTRTNRITVYRYLVCTLLLSLLITLLPTPTYAQEPGNAIFLPLITNGEGQANNGPNADDQNHLEAAQTGVLANNNPQDINDIDAALMANARQQLPNPFPTALVDIAATDIDGDGVRNGEDNCPFQPNPPINGKQPVFCGREMHKMIDEFVFLKSRIFRPMVGLDPMLSNTQPRERIHALLHINRSENGVVLSTNQRQRLAAAGVQLLGYLPHYTYYVSLPRNGEQLQQINALDIVHGISAIRPHDKVAPQVRLNGPVDGRDATGSFSFDVDFHSDVTHSTIEAMLTQLGRPFTHQYSNTYRVTFTEWEQFLRLVIQDFTYWIDDVPRDPVNMTLNGQSVVGGFPVSNTLGYRGSELVVSMTESAHAGPSNHPDMNGRITEANSPVGMGTPDGDHAQMVSAIMIADETSFPDRRGLLPDAELVTYSNSGIITIERQHFGIPKEAREDHGALLSNNSWGVNNCNKIGTYTNRAKFYDKAVHEIGVVVVVAAGNGRGVDGDFNNPNVVNTPCLVDLYSLPHSSTAKNTLTVGNMAVGQSSPGTGDGITDATVDGISGLSSAGPTADERLKPDIVAPGNGLFTVDYLEASNTVAADIGSGTSAAAPFTAGVVGWLAESFENQGEDSNTVAPARYKAILVHTAQDQGVPGPDYYHGYGLIQADKALRIAEEWASWGHEGAVTDSIIQDTIYFDVDSAMTFYKATLAWDDKKGEHTSSMALKNDLDLTLISPSGVVYYPWDLILPFGATIDDGSIPCIMAACQDRVNNVEQVVVQPTGNGLIEQGTWQALVTAHRLVTNDQSYSLVLTPPCPVVVSASIILTEDIECDPQLLEPTGVQIVNDGVDLNCNGHSINGKGAVIDNFSGSWVGIRSEANNVTIHDCDVRRFDVGIAVEPDGDTVRTNNVIRNNILEILGSVGIKLIGDDHTASANEISEFVWTLGRGIKAQGDRLSITNNRFEVAVLGGGTNSQTIAVDVLPGSEDGEVNDNDFSGMWKEGIRLRSAKESDPVDNMIVSGNEFEGIAQTPIVFLGNVQGSTISDNDIFSYGSGYYGVAVLNSDSGLRPEDNSVRGNLITGFDTQSQKGIHVSQAKYTEVIGNILDTVAMGILEEEAEGTIIQANRINPAQPGGGFRTDYGIQSIDSKGAIGGAAHIAGNTINWAQVGIEVLRPWSAVVAGNTIGNTGTGINMQANGVPVAVSGNAVSPDMRGIMVLDSPLATINANTISNMNGNFGGIGVARSDQAEIADNLIFSPIGGISVDDSINVTLERNQIDNPALTGLYLIKADNAFVDSNEIFNNGTIGIQYASGDNATLTNNTVTSVFPGISIRLGDGSQPGCVIDVDNILVQDNALSGGTPDIEQLCDVGTATLINN